VNERVVMAINVVIAFLLDLLIGDPPIGAHPVRLVGRMLDAFEGLFYPMKRKFIGGLLLVVCSLCCVSAVMIGLWYLMPLCTLPLSINVVLIILLFFLFCNRDMVREARKIQRYLEQDRLDEARVQVGRIVGRDTSGLGKGDIIRATVESIAENVVDGFTAPLFYLLIGGVPLAYVYKTVNTIDSRFGYRNERYESFGKAGARLDDALGFVPARLNALLSLCATGFSGDVFRRVRTYGRSHPSPNSGIAEAVFAGYLGMALGGPSRYGSLEKEKPWIGENRIPDEELENPQLILRAIGLYWRIVSVTLIVGVAVLTFLNLPLLFGLRG
jgi:adenosylcobinamide-phosphate synthase